LHEPIVQLHIPPRLLRLPSSLGFKGKREPWFLTKRLYYLYFALGYWLLNLLGKLLPALVIDSR
jgi:hypothetical protein